MKTGSHTTFQVWVFIYLYIHFVI